MNSSEISRYMANRALEYYNKHSESLDNKCKKLVEIYGKLDYKIVEHETKINVYELDIIRLKKLINQLSKTVVILHNHICTFNFNNMTTDEIKHYINSYDIFNVHALWIEIGDSIEYRGIQTYFNNHIIMYMIKTSMDLPNIPYSIYKNATKFNSFLVSKFNNDELHVASKHGIFSIYSNR